MDNTRWRTRRESGRTQAGGEQRGRHGRQVGAAGHRGPFKMEVTHPSPPLHASPEWRRVAPRAQADLPATPDACGKLRRAYAWPWWSPRWGPQPSRPQATLRASPFLLQLPWPLHPVLPPARPDGVPVPRRAQTGGAAPRPREVRGTSVPTRSQGRPPRPHGGRGGTRGRGGRGQCGRRAVVPTPWTPTRAAGGGGVGGKGASGARERVSCGCTDRTRLRRRHAASPRPSTGAPPALSAERDQSRDLSSPGAPPRESETSRHALPPLRPLPCAP